MKFQRPVQKNAEYLPQEVEDYRGNPLIEALGEMPTTAELRSALDYSPVIPTHRDRRLSEMARLRAVNNLHHVVMPTPEYKKAAFEILLLLREGYVARNPFSNESEARLTAVSNWDFKNPLKLPPQWKSTASGHLILSPTGTGKTTFMNALLMRIPQVIEHREYRGQKYVQTQVVYVKISVPPDGTVKAFCLTFFDEVDRLLGTTYYKRALALSTIPKMAIYMGQVATAIGLGMLIVDEFQNLRCARTEQGVHVLNLFVSLMEDSGVPVITMATPKVHGLLESLTRDTRKLISGGTTTFQPIARHDPYWPEFCTRLWDLTYTTSKPELTQPILTAWYQASGGIAAFVVLAFIAAQKNAILQDSVVDEHTFEGVRNTELAMLGPAISAICSGNKDRLSIYEDLLMGSATQALLDQMLPNREIKPTASNVPMQDDQSDEEFLGLNSSKNYRKRSGAKVKENAPAEGTTPNSPGKNQQEIAEDTNAQANVNSIGTLPTRSILEDM